MSSPRKRKSLLNDLLTSHVPLKRIHTAPGPVSSSVVNEILGPCPICCDSDDEILVPLHRTSQNDEKILREIFLAENYVNDLLWNCIACSKTLRELGELKSQKDHIENRIEQITFCIQAVVRNKKTKDKSYNTNPKIKLEVNLFSPDISPKEEVEPEDFTIVCKELEWTDSESDYYDVGLSEEIEETSVTIATKFPILNEKERSDSNQSSNENPTFCLHCCKEFSNKNKFMCHIRTKSCQNQAEFKVSCGRCGSLFARREAVNHQCKTVTEISGEFENISKKILQLTCNTKEFEKTLATTINSKFPILNEKELSYSNQLSNDKTNTLCVHCFKVFSNKNKFTCHITTKSCQHQAESKVSCGRCSSWLMRKDVINHRCKTLTEISGELEGISKKIFQFASNATNTSSTHRDQTIIENEFPVENDNGDADEGNVEIVTENVQLNQELEYSIEENSSNFKVRTSCDNCGKTFSSKYYVRRHMENKVCTKDKRPNLLFEVSEKSDDVSNKVLQFTPEIKQGDAEETAQQNNELYLNEENNFEYYDDEVKVEFCEDIGADVVQVLLGDDHGEENVQELVQEEEAIPAENIEQDTTKRVQRASKVRASERILSLLQKKSKNEESEYSEQEDTISELEHSKEFDDNDSDFSGDESTEEQMEGDDWEEKNRETSLKVIKSLHCKICKVNCVDGTAAKWHVKSKLHKDMLREKSESNVEDTNPEDDKPNNCDICAGEIIGSKAYQRHLYSNIHNLAVLCKIKDSGGYKCVLEQCGQIFNLIHDLVKHFRIHPNECKPCKRSFKNIASYIEHLLRPRHHENIGPDALIEFEKLKTISCNSCDKRFPTLSSLKGHQKNTLNLSFICEICGNTFCSESGLKTHQLTHQDKPLKPPPIPKEVVRSAPPKQKSIFCKLCGKGFSKRSSLYQHNRIVHRGYRFKCGLCPKEYLTTVGLRKHKLSAHGTQEEREEVKSKRCLSSSCGICGKSLVGKSRLSIHMELAHFSLRESCPAGCELEEKFKNDDEWKEHLENCKSEKLGEPAKCFFCRAIFPNSLLRLYHQFQSHQTYSCEYCNKSFTKPDVLNQHLYKHKESRRFLCTKCGKSFRASYNLMLHMKTVCNDDEDSKKVLAEKRKKQYLDFRNKSKDYKCNKCSKRFVDEKKLKEHLEKAHEDLDENQEEEELNGE